MSAEVEQRATALELPSRSGLEDQLVRLAVADPTRFVALFKRIRESHSAEVTRACIRHLAEHGLDAAGSKMQVWLISNTYYLDLLLDPNFLTDEQAFRVAGIMRDASYQFSFNLQLRITQGEASCDLKHLTRAVYLTKAFVDPGILIPWLRNLTQHSDELTRSKAAKLLCELRPNPRMIETQLKSEDARVRANAVEAAWSMNGFEVVDIFKAALGDESYRVVVNAAIGLCRLGIEGAFEELLSLTRHPSENMRCAAVWGLGFVENPAAIPRVKELIDDESSTVALKALAALDKLVLLVDQNTPVPGGAEKATPPPVASPKKDNGAATEQRPGEQGHGRKLDILKI